MSSSVRRPASWVSSIVAFRALAVALALAYVALAGESVHCRYFPTSHHEHDGHSTDTKQAAGHAAHCLISSHASASAVTADATAALPAPAPTARLVSTDHSHHVTSPNRLTPARAPPFV